MDSLPARDTNRFVYGGRTVATYFFEEMTAAQAASFNSATDQMIFTNQTVTAAQVSVSFVPFTVNTPDYVILTAPTKTLQFSDPNGFRATSNMGGSAAIFADSSLLYAGTTGDDTVQGGSAADGLYGGTGDDSLRGGDGNDVLQGNQGEDTLSGEAGDDVIYGGRDNDTIDVGGFSSASVLQFAQGNLGDDTITGGA
ncbi:MAG: hypothetical protein JHD15_14940, partial [Phenylobacterium sp.]|uniref:calcium-binding protein n=1 Tax=Phenylobacterium sp. TaxID=1871053 RepID=UPI001A28C2E9|nr:hypothetical protein [Phenylobacterium sp.]